MYIKISVFNSISAQYFEEIDLNFFLFQIKKY